MDDSVTRTQDNRGAGNRGTDNSVPSADAPSTDRALPHDVPATAPGARFTILSPHAEGGLGRVHKAWDEQLGRTVALKEIRPDRADQPHVRQRFLAEAEITGQLEHPGIVPIYALEHDAAGRPVYAMRFIQGRTLADAIRAYHERQTSLGLRELLQRFIAVCQTLAYAHTKGVIHRDLKPANVMLGDYGETLVVDWGLAKRVGTGLATASARTGAEPAGSTAMATTQTVDYASPEAEGSSGQMTTAGQVLGTPAYMAPEQARGEVEAVGPAADVYALGAILYEILTGHAPYRGQTAAEVLKQVHAGPPLAPVARALRVPKALNALCLKAMAREAPSRYAAAGDLAREVERWLADEPVAAYREPLTARLGRWSRRHRTLVTAVCLLVVASGAFAWWQDRQAVARRDQLGRNAETAAALLEQATEALKANDPDRADVALGQVEKRLADGGADELKERFARLRADLILLRHLDRIDVVRFNPVNGRFALFADLAKSWAEAFAEFGIVPGTTPPEEADLLLSRSAARDRALAALDRWLVGTRSVEVGAILTAADPDPFRAAIRTAIRERANFRMVELAAQDAALSQPAWFTAVLGDGQSAIPEDRRRVLLERALSVQPGDVQVLMALGMLYRIGQRDGAENRLRWYQAAVSVRPRLTSAWNGLGNALKDKGEADAAIVAYKEASRLDPTYVGVYCNLGLALYDKGDLDGAIAAAKVAIQLDPTDPMFHSNLGIALRAKGDFDGAIVAYKEALRVDPNYAMTHNNMGVALCDKGDLNSAIEWYRAAIRLDPNHGGYRANLGTALHRKGDVEGAIECLREAIRLMPNHSQLHYDLGQVLRASDVRGSIACLREAIRLNPKSPKAYVGLGLSLENTNDLNGAIAAYKEAIRLDPKYALAHNNLGWRLYVKGDRDGAIAGYKEAIRLDPKHALAHNNLGWALEESGDLAEALSWYQKALALDPKNALVQRNVARVGPLIPLLPRLDDVASARANPASAAEACAFGMLCSRPFRKQYAASTRLYAWGFATDPKLSDDLAAGNRYSAACSAALAGGGKGVDAPAESAKRAALRKQALRWLQADLALWARHCDTGDLPARQKAAQMTNSWLRAPDFAAVRFTALLATLPADEIKEWQTLWLDVHRLRDKASAASETPTPLRPRPRD